VLRSKPKGFYFLLFLGVTLSSLAGPSLVFARAASTAKGDAQSMQESLERISRRPDKEISLLPTLFLASGEGARKLTGRLLDTGLVEKEIDRIAWRVSASLVGAREPRRAIAAMNQVLFADEGFVYDSAAGEADNYLLDRVIAQKRGNCLGLTFIYLALGERLGIPLQGAYVPTHCFARYEENGVRINIETGEKGAERDDRWYAWKFKVGEGRPYLQTLGKREMIGVYLKSLGAALSRRGMEKDALQVYRQASLFSPGLPDVYYNAGVSYQKLGKNDDAVAQYRKALALDPDLEIARGNLGAALCSCGKVEEGIQEFLKAIEINPENIKARAGLAKAYFSQGAYRQSIAHCDRAMEQGCNFDPSMLEVLARYRAAGDLSSRHGSDPPGPSPGRVSE
jgi:tetratricopeptide (TPR) repeat protein